MVYEEIITILGALGVSGLLGASVTYILDKRKQIKFREQDYKEIRYKAIIVQMTIILNPQKFKNFPHKPDNWHTIEDVKEETENEWFNMILFASDDVIRNLKAFLLKPNPINFAQTAIVMRKDCWNKKTSLKTEELGL